MGSENRKSDGGVGLPHRVGLVCYLGRQIGWNAQIVRGALTWLGWELRRGPRVRVEQNYLGSIMRSLERTPPFFRIGFFQGDRL